ncbi:MAG TPA: acetyl-CoA carboxylase biotin carboxyl carrier protein [Gemmatimonadaceae bacterium]|nr:acetyl-CoA carboxylase biotin carboxyl carrier protein [Gemmatimonadaceae bacterium]
MIDLRYLKKVLEMLDESTVDSLEITSDKGMKLRVSKSPTQRGTVMGAQMMAAPAAAAAPAPVAAAAPAAPAVEAPKPASTLLEVKSPMVGTFYAKPEPGANPYASVGTRVSKGQILCIIEAMKIMNEIECDVSGTVVDVAVQDSSAVEYGQVLFRVDPNV